MKLERVAGVNHRVSLGGELCVNVGRSFHMKYDSLVHIRVCIPIDNRIISNEGYDKLLCHLARIEKKKNT